MPIQLECSSCGKKLKAPDNLAGKKVKCPQCSNVLQVPEAVAQAENIPLTPSEAAETESSGGGEGRRPCPMCGEMIVADAVKCRFCGEIFDETLKRAEKKKKGGVNGGEPTVADYVIAVLCPGIGCIAGVIWMIQGKKKGLRIFLISLAVNVFWGVVQAIIQSNAPHHP